MKALAKFLNVEHQEINYEEDNYTIFDQSISRDEALKRNAEIVTCPKCGVSGNRPNMMRWHFESCKTVLKSCKQCGNTIPRQGIKDHLYNSKTYCNRKCYMESKKGKNPIEMTEEVKEKISKKMTKYFSEPKNRQKVSERQKLYYARKNNNT